MATRADHDQILRYLDTHGVRDKDAVSRRTSRAVPRTRRQRPAELDLHGLTQDRAARALRNALERGKRDGVRVMIVVHGQGLHSSADDGAVLKRMVAMMLDGECKALVRDHRPAPPRMGGDGATLVYL